MKLYNKEELKDARIFFDKMPPPFMTVFIIFFVVVIIVSIIVANAVKKPYVVRAQGAVAVDGTSYIASKGYGVITKIHARPGDYVREGEVLLSISSGSEELQTLMIQEQIDDLEDTLEVMARYKTALLEQGNDFSRNGKELEYYAKTQYYLDILKMDQFDKNNMTKQLAVKKKDRDNLKIEIAALQKELDEILREDESHPDRVEVGNNIDIKSTEIEGVAEEIGQLERQLNSPYSQAGQVLNQLLGELGQSQTGILSKIAELRSNLAASTNQDAIFTIVASQAGELHYLQPLAEGMAIQQNQILGEIAHKDHELYIDAYISAADRSGVKVGNSVKVSIIGVNSYRFGTLSGVLDFIEPGTLQNESSGEVVVFYRAKIRLHETSLKSKSGEGISLLRSMPVEVRVVYSEESYLEWFLNLLNLRTH